jgi:hypothetical protein
MFPERQMKPAHGQTRYLRKLRYPQRLMKVPGNVIQAPHDTGMLNDPPDHQWGRSAAASGVR